MCEASTSYILFSTYRHTAAVHHKLIGFGDTELQVIFVDAPCDVAALCTSVKIVSKRRWYVYRWKHSLESDMSIQRSLPFHQQMHLILVGYLL